MNPKINWRKLFLNVHLWLGLASSVIVLILCLTGTVLGLQGPIEGWVNRDVLRVQPQASPLALETLIPRVAEATGKTFTAVVVKPEPDAAWQLMEGRKATYIDPYTGEVLGQLNPPVNEAFMTVFRLHRWLLLDRDLGRTITGAATLVFVVTLLTGVFLWWPRRLAHLGKALRFRKGGNWKAWNYDLHVVLGAYALLPLLVMGLSGLYWSYNQPFKAVVYRVFDGQPMPVEERAAAPGRDAKPSIDLPYSRILAETNQAYPYAGPVHIGFPAAEGQPVTVRKVHMPHAVSLPYADRLTLDARTGEILKRVSFSERSRAEQLLSLIKDIHIGTVFGGLSLTLYVIASLIGTSLPLTGALHWLSKLRARRRSRAPVVQAKS